MFNAKPSGAERADFFINQQFRQVGFLRTLRKPDGTSSPFTEETGNTLTTLNFASLTTPFEKDQVITGGTSGAKAIVDFDSTGSTGVLKVLCLFIKLIVMDLHLLLREKQLLHLVVLLVYFLVVVDTIVLQK